MLDMSVTSAAKADRTTSVEKNDGKGKIAAKTTPESEGGKKTSESPETGAITVSSSLTDAPVASWVAPRGNKVILPQLDAKFLAGVDERQSTFVRVGHQQAKADLVEVASLSLKYEDYEWISFALTGKNFQSLDPKVAEVIVALVKEMADGKINLNMHTEAFADRNEVSAFFEKNGRYEVVLNTDTLSHSAAAVIAHHEDEVAERIKAEIIKRFGLDDFPLNRLNFHHKLDALAEPDTFLKTSGERHEHAKFVKALEGYKAEFDEATGASNLVIGEHLSPIFGEAFGEAYFHRFKDLLTEAGLAGEIRDLPLGDAGHRVAMNAFQDSSNYIGAQSAYITPESHPEHFTNEKDIHDVTRRVLGGQQNVNVTYAADTLGLVYEKDVPLWLETSLANLQGINLEFLANIVGNFRHYLVSYAQSIHENGDGDTQFAQSLSDDYQFFQPQIATIREFLKDAEVNLQKLYKSDKSPDNLALAKKLEEQIKIIEGQLQEMESLHEEMFALVKEDVLTAGAKGIVALKELETRLPYDEFRVAYSMTAGQVEGALGAYATLDYMYPVRKYILDANHGAVRHWLNNHGVSDKVIDGTLRAIDAVVGGAVAIASAGEVGLATALVKFVAVQAGKEALRFGANKIIGVLEEKFGELNFKSPVDLYKHMEDIFGKKATDKFFGGLTESVGGYVVAGLRPLAELVTPVLSAGTDLVGGIIERIEKKGVDQGYHKIFEQSDGMISAMSAPTAFTENKDEPKLDETGKLARDVFESPHLKEALQSAGKIFGENSKQLEEGFYDTVFGDEITDSQKDKIREFMLDAIGLTSVEGEIPEELMNAFNKKYDLSWGSFGSALIQRHAYVVNRPDDSLEIFFGDHILKAAGKNTDAPNLEQMFFADTVIEELIDAAATYAGVRGAEHTEVQDFEKGDIGARGLNYILHSGVVSSNPDHIRTPHLLTVTSNRDAQDADKILLEDGSEVHSRSIEGFLGLFGRIVFQLEGSLFTKASVREKDVSFWSQGSLQKYKSSGTDEFILGAQLQVNMLGTFTSNFLRNTEEDREEGYDRSGKGQWKHGSMASAIKAGDFFVAAYAAYESIRQATDIETGKKTKQSPKEDWLTSIIPTKGKKFSDLGVFFTASPNFVGQNRGRELDDEGNVTQQTPLVWNLNFDLFALHIQRGGIPIVSDLLSMGVKNSGFFSPEQDRVQVDTPFEHILSAKDATFHALGAAIQFIQHPVETVMKRLMASVQEDFVSPDDQAELDFDPREIELTVHNREGEEVPVTVTPQSESESGHFVSFVSDLEEAQSSQGGPSGEGPAVADLFAAGTSASAGQNRGEPRKLVKVDLEVDPDTDYVTVKMTPLDHETGQPSTSAEPTTFRSQRYDLPEEEDRRARDPHIRQSEIQPETTSSSSEPAHPIARQVVDPGTSDLDGDGVSNVNDANEEAVPVERNKFGAAYFQRTTPDGTIYDLSGVLALDTILGGYLGVGINVEREGVDGEEGAKGWGVHLGAFEYVTPFFNLNLDVVKPVTDRKFRDRDGEERTYGRRGRRPTADIPFSGFARVAVRGHAAQELTFGYNGFHTDKDTVTI